MKYLIGIAFIVILGALAFAGVSMVRDGRNGKPKTDTMMRALALRVGVSVLLFLCLMGSYLMGWIQPTGIPRG
jgi:Na+/H+ antiporter NhaC